MITQNNVNLQILLPVLYLMAIPMSHVMFKVSYANVRAAIARTANVGNKIMEIAAVVHQRRYRHNKRVSAIIVIA